MFILGNMANDGYAVAKPMWELNKDVDLGINTSDFGMALPEWEDAHIKNEVDPYKIERDQLRSTWKAPKRVRYFNFQNKTSWRENFFGKMKAYINVIRMIREYDVIETHVPWAIYAQFSGIPYVVYDAGWIRYLQNDTGIRNKLARRGYSKAKSIIFTNPDTWEIFEKQKYLPQEKIHFVPFAIDHNKYKPADSTDLRSKYVKEDDILLFSPSRQSWAEKGNDKMIRAYARFLKQYPNSKFVIVSWSIDEENSKKLARSLGIIDNIIWIKPVPKIQLIQYYNASDIILDQFVLGSWGTSTPEAMSCGKPVLMFYKKNHILRAFGEEPPILNSPGEEDIYSNLLKLAKDADLRKDLGKKSREWVIKTHSPVLVASKHIQILEDALN
ncbi:MAG: glycosyltransferase family 4 protein [Thaumarchaeota archaeon]|nr:glycosyltransferase family 4 protein [Nitrososphaerota archaeon]